MTEAGDIVLAGFMAGLALADRRIHEMATEHLTATAVLDSVDERRRAKAEMRSGDE